MAADITIAHTEGPHANERKNGMEGYLDLEDLAPLDSKSIRKQ